MFTEQGRPIWTVSELSTAIKDQLSQSFPKLQVKGEISNCRPSGAGHVYLTLKDKKAVINAVLFRGRANSIPIQPLDGMQVIATGRLDVYPPRGSYQLIVEYIEEYGRGALLEALNQQKEQLAKEGLFNQDLKSPLPQYPRRVAVVTSPTGAAIRDILNVFSRHSTAPQVMVLPTPVQGDNAAAMIADQLTRAAVYNLGEVIILARGGGSLEDLMPFNDEKVVRAIVACTVPVVSGVGHEIDVSLADLAADVRASTPSTAAELVCGRSEDLWLRTHGFKREAADIMRHRISEAMHHLNQNGKSKFLAVARSQLESWMWRSDKARSNIAQPIAERLLQLRHRVEMALQGIHEMSPENIMKRGFSKVFLNGIAVRDAQCLAPGDDITLEFARGKAQAKVQSTKG